MNKEQILAEIKRLADEGGGIAPGQEVFEKRTGIKRSEWYPYVWLRWSDALVDAGYVPHELRARTSDDIVVTKYIELIRELCRVPVVGEIRRKAKSDKSFPGYDVFNRFGGKNKLINATVAYCKKNLGFEDVLAICSATKPEVSAASIKREGNHAVGCVYLMRFGRKDYKVGHTNSVYRRSKELGTITPTPHKTIHSIETDDPSGVEAYWHRRFVDKRKRGEGEFFTLSEEDVKAFKRWKKIV